MHTHALAKHHALCLCALQAKRWEPPMASRRTPEQLEYAAGLLKQLSDLAHNVAQTRRERDRLLARLFREQLATTGEIASATGLSPNRIRGIAAAAPVEVAERE